MRKFPTVSSVLLAASLAWTALPAAAANITYFGSDTEGAFSVTYSITTDGTLGLLSLANIVTTSATFTGSFGQLTGTDTFYFNNSNPGALSPVTATASSLLYDFGGGGIVVIALGDAAPPGFEGLLFALAGAQSTDDDNNVFHQGVQPDREIDNVNSPPGNFYLVPGTYTLTTPTVQAFATVGAAAVPEPASWSLLALGVAGMGLAARNRRRGIVERR